MEGARRPSSSYSHTSTLTRVQQPHTASPRVHGTDATCTDVTSTDVSARGALPEHGIARTKTEGLRPVPQCAAGLPGGSLEISKRRTIPKSLTTVPGGESPTPALTFTRTPTPNPTSEAARAEPCHGATWHASHEQGRGNARRGSRSVAEGRSAAPATGAGAPCDAPWPGDACNNSLRGETQRGREGKNGGVGPGAAPVPACDTVSSVALEFGALLLLLQMHPTQAEVDWIGTQSQGAGPPGGVREGERGAQLGGTKLSGGVREGGSGAQLGGTKPSRDEESAGGGGAQVEGTHLFGGPGRAPQGGRPPGSVPQGIITQDGIPKGGVPAALPGPSLRRRAPHDCLVVRYGPSSDAAYLPPEVAARRTRKLQAMLAELEEILGEWALEQQLKQEFEEQCEGQGAGGACGQGRKEEFVEQCGRQGVRESSHSHCHSVPHYSYPHSHPECPHSHFHSHYTHSRSCWEEDPAASPAYTGSLILAPSSSAESAGADAASEEASLGSFLTGPPAWEDRATWAPPSGPRRHPELAPEARGDRLALRGPSRGDSWRRAAVRELIEGHIPCPQQKGESQTRRQGGRRSSRLIPRHRRGKRAHLLLCMGFATPVEEAELEAEGREAVEGGGRLPAAVYRGHSRGSVSDALPTADSLCYDAVRGAAYGPGEDAKTQRGDLDSAVAEHPKGATLCTMTSSLCEKSTSVTPSLCIGRRVVLVPTDLVDCVEAEYRGVRVCSLAPGVEEYCDATDEDELDEYVDRIIGILSEFHRTNYCEWPLAHLHAKAMWSGA